MTDSDLERLSELAQRTDDIRPSGSFADSVMAAIEDEAATASPRIGEELTRSGWVAVAFAAVAAAAAVMMSIDAQQQFDEDVLVSIDVTEIVE